MYRRPKFLEVLLRIREEMAREADYDVDLFAQMARLGKRGEKPMEMRADNPGTQKRKKTAPKSS